MSVAAAIWTVAKRSVIEFFDDRCTQHAAAISYYGLFSLFPLVILAVVGFGLFASDATVRDSVIDLVEQNLPIDRGEGTAQLRDALEGVTGNPGGLGLLGLGGLLFAATGLMGALRTALNAAYDRSDEGRPPVRGKLFDVLLVMSAGLVVILSVGLTFVARLASPVLALGQLTPVLISFAVFSFLYLVVPTGQVRPREVVPGAVFAAVAFELLKTGFAVYVENFRDYSAVYGSVGAVIAFLFFVFLAANLFLLGAEINTEARGFRRLARSAAR